MSKYNLAYYVLIPLVTFLGVYGIFLAATLKKTGWDLKGLLITICVVLPGLGFLITLIVRTVRHRRLKKQELESQSKSENVSLTGGHPVLPKESATRRIFRAQVKTVIMSLVISQALYLAFLYSMKTHLSRKYPPDMDRILDSLIQERRKKAA
jgi:hypothetical protein